MLVMTVANIICQMVFGRGFEYEDQHFQTMLKNLIECGRIWKVPSGLTRLPGRHNEIFSNFRSLETLIRGEVERHKLSMDPDPNTDPRELHGRLPCGDAEGPRKFCQQVPLCVWQHRETPELGFNEGNLALCCLDLFLAGSETTSKTLQWAIIYMINNPQVQEKVQAEIDGVVGGTRQPSMSDRASMPYTDAVIHEIQRMGNIVPLNGLRRAAKDTTLAGYFIPKVLGKRACLGENLATIQLFLFFVNLMQKFSFSTLDGVQLSTEGIIGATRSPH
ncbi:hypothetical protein CRUP_014753, partial [Coryphaenoides rupestris]